MPAIIKVVDGRTIIKMGENTALASKYATLAEQFANAAGVSADAVEIAAAAVGVYTTVGAGESATANGQSFYVASGGDVTLYINNAGTGDEVASLTTAAALASTAPGEGVDLIGTVTSPGIPNPVVLRTILLDAQVSRMLSATGDGDTDPSAVTAETAKFQDIVDTGRSFEVPEPNMFYAVNQIVLGDRQQIKGAGQFLPNKTGADQSNGNRYMFAGNGTDAVFLLGDGTLSGPRRQSLLDISVFNDGASCIEVLGAPNWLIERVRADSIGAVSTIRGNLAFRGALRDSTVSVAGAGTAIDFINNVNGCVFDHNTVTGGSAGRAMRIGNLLGSAIVNNIIESSLDGIHVSSDSDSGNGNSNGLTISGNYIEQCKTPLILAKQFTIFGLECSANIISNSAISTIAAREASIQFGRIRGGSITDNSILVDSTEDVFWVWMTQATGDIEKLTVARNNIGGDTPANMWVGKGTYGTNPSVKSVVGSKCRFDFMTPANGVVMASENVREWVSPEIDFSDTAAPDDNVFKTWLSQDDIAFGGKVIAAELIDFDGGSVATGLANVRLFVGRTGAPTETVAISDLSALTFASGRAELTLGAGSIYAGQDMQWKVDRSPAALPTGKARLRLRYRLN